MAESQENLNKSEGSLCDPFENVIGSIGKWQMGIFLLIGLTRMTITYNQMSHIFLAPTVAFRCKTTFDYNISHADADYFDSVCIANCTEYEYDRSIFTDTILMDFDLICEKSWLADMTQTIFMIGMTAGGLVVGHVGDMFGRRIPQFICLVTILCLGIANAFSVNYIMYAILRFCIGFITNGMVVLGYVLLLECTGIKYRVILTTLIHVPSTLAVAVLGIFGYFIRSWKMLQLAISIPSVIYLFYIWMPESPRWLMSVGKTKQAKLVIENACRWNKRPTNGIDKAIDEMKLIIERKTKSKAKFIDLFKPVLLKESICVSVIWFVCGINYFGTTFYLGQVGGNIFINLIISGSIQVPTVLLTLYVTSNFGRKKTLITSYTGCGLFMLLLTSTTISSITWLRITLAIASTICLTVAFNVGYLFTSEIFPTVVRNSGVGLGSTAARIGSMIAPYVASLAVYNTLLPPILFGSLALVAAFACLPLEETAGKELKDTLEK